MKIFKNMHAYGALEKQQERERARERERERYLEISNPAHGEEF